MSERFYVAITHGALQPNINSGTAHRRLGAAVLDRAYAHEAVAVFRSEEMSRRPGLGLEKENSLALDAAVARARELNEKHGPIDF